jgi:ribosomal protein L29
MVTLDELKLMKTSELNHEHEKASYELLKLRMALASRQSKETSKVKALRKYIARINTIKRFMKVERAPENKKSAITK